MDYLGVILLFIILTLCYVIARSIAFTNRNIEKDKKNYLALEAKANATRKQDISSLDYITIDLSRLPVEEAKILGLDSLIEAIESLSAKKIVNLSMYSNTDLKLMYGPANLDELASYDNNFTELIRTLNQLAHKLLDANNCNDQISISSPHYTAAINVLEYAVEIGSDITSTYTTLGELYHQSGDKNKLKKLINSAKKLTSLSGKTIVKRLNDIAQA